MVFRPGSSLSSPESMAGCDASLGTWRRSAGLISRGEKRGGVLGVMSILIAAGRTIALGGQ